jgi:hypothetical protein
VRVGWVAHKLALTVTRYTKMLTSIPLIALLSIVGVATANEPTAEPTTTLKPTISKPSFRPTTNEPSSVETGDTVDNNSTCIDTPGWSDLDDFPCAWYEEHDASGCPKYGDSYPWKFKDGVIYEPFGDGTATQNCCHCMIVIPTAKPTSSCSGNTPNWTDIDDYTCDWYEANDAPGCPSYGNKWKGSQGVANDNCCYCFGTGSPTAVTDFPTIASVPTPTPTD